MINKFIIFIIINLFIKVNSISINEYNCLKSLVEDLHYNFTNQLSGGMVYDFCSTVVNLCDIDGNVAGPLYLTYGSISPSTEVALSGDKITCLPNLLDLTIDSITIDSNFLYTQFPSLKQLKLINIILSPFTNKIKPLSYLSIQRSNIDTLPLSTFVNIKFLDIQGNEMTIVDDIIDYFGDAKLTLEHFIVTPRNLIDFSDFNNLKTLALYFGDHFDLGSILSNFSKLKSVQYLTIYHTAISAVPLYLESLNSVKELTFTGLITEKITQPCDLSQMSNLVTLHINLVTGSQFNLNGELPLIVNPSTNLYVSGANLTVFPKYLNFLPTSTLSIRNSNLPTTLSKFNGVGNLFDFANNNLEGTIDQSWCTTQLNVQGNKLTDKIPSCFTCFFKSSQEMFDRFKGNQFINYNKSIECTTFKPVVQVLNTQDFNTFSLIGGDIGYNTSNFLINGTEIEFTIQSNGGFIGKLNNGNNFKNLNWFDIMFLNPVNVVYTFPVDRSILPVPLSTRVTIGSVNIQFMISGNYFPSYPEYYGLIIKLNNIECVMTSQTFFYVICSIPLVDFNILDPNSVKVDLIRRSDTKSFIISSENLKNNELVCLNDCTSINNGLCDMNIGSCKCNSNFQGNDCSIPFINCPIGSGSLICSGSGTCLNTTGACMCNSDRTKLDCSGIKCNVPNCSNNGVCDQTVGLCVCQDKKWLGSDCTIPYHYITSTTSSTINGGNIIISGSFGINHGGLAITIGGIDCKVNELSITPNEIQCEAPPGNGIKQLIVIQNGGTAKLNYQYTEINQVCPLNCSNHGTCNTNNGQCTCNIGYSSHDCSIKNSDDDNGNTKPPSTNTTIDSNTGGTNFVNQEINFQIYFKSLSEIDINGNTIEVHSLQDKWILNSTNQQNQHTFKQTIQTDNTCSIISTIEEIKDKQGKQFEFAGTTFKLDQDSIKFTISISNYTFKNNLNTLQLNLISTVEQNEENDCNSKDTEIDTNDLSTFNYIKISKNNKILSGRFINKLISDGKPTFLSTAVTKEQESIIVSLSLPHCTECKIDPDFSVLVSNDYKSECNSSSSRKWVIPVAVVVSIVGAATVAAVLFLILKKNTTIKVQLHKLKRLNK